MGRELLREIPSVDELVECDRPVGVCRTPGEKRKALSLRVAPGERAFSRGGGRRSGRRVGARRLLERRRPEEHNATPRCPLFTAVNTREDQGEVCGRVADP